MRADPDRHDIPVSPSGMVSPFTGGMSVAPGTPFSLPEFRRPNDFGGSGKDPVWSITIRELAPNLQFTPENIRHGFMEPSRGMDLRIYESALEATQRRGQREPP